jgi:transposase-like protein
MMKKRGFTKEEKLRIIKKVSENGVITQSNQ